MRKLRTIKPWNLRAVRLKTALTAAPITAESLSQRGPGANQNIDDAVCCRGAISKVSLRANTRAVRTHALRGVMPVALRPR